MKFMRKRMPVQIDDSTWKIARCEQCVPQKNNNPRVYQNPNMSNNSHVPHRMRLSLYSAERCPRFVRMNP